MEIGCVCVSSRPLLLSIFVALNRSSIIGSFFFLLFINFVYEFRCSFRIVRIYLKIFDYFWEFSIEMKEEKKNRSILLTIPATGTAAPSFIILGHSSNSIAMRAYLRIIYTIACDCYFFVSFISLFISVFACKHTHRHRVCSVWNH